MNLRQLLWAPCHALARRTSWSWYPLGQFRDGIPCKVPLDPYLSKYGAACKEQGGWSLRVSAGWEFNVSLRLTHGYDDAMYRDCPHGFYLCRDDRAVAVATFELCDEGIVVRQLQGKRGEREVLSRLRWDRMLLRVIVDWARAQRYPWVACIRGDRSAWCTKERVTAFHIRYDGSARREGFRYSDERGMWLLPLTAPASL